MRSIIDAVEKQFDYVDFHHDIPPEVKTGDIPAIMSYNAVSVAYLCNAKALIVLTETGHAARLLSRLRPRMPIESAICAAIRHERYFRKLSCKE